MTNEYEELMEVFCVDGAIVPHTYVSNNKLSVAQVKTIQRALTIAANQAPQWLNMADAQLEEMKQIAVAGILEGRDKNHKLLIYDIVSEALNVLAQKNLIIQPPNMKGGE